MRAVLMELLLVTGRKRRTEGGHCSLIVREHVRINIVRSAEQRSADSRDRMFVLL